MRIYTRDPKKHWSNLGYSKQIYCERCYSKKQLCVHHKDRYRGNNEPFNLETLCRLCHIQEHRDEVAESQRRDEVNARRGASISRTKIAARKAGKKYPKMSEALRKNWKGPTGDHLRKVHKSKRMRKLRSENMKRLMNDPAHMEKRRLMKEARRENS